MTFFFGWECRLLLTDAFGVFSKIANGVIESKSIEIVSLREQVASTTEELADERDRVAHTQSELDAVCVKNQVNADEALLPRSQARPFYGPMALCRTSRTQTRKQRSRTCFRATDSNNSRRRPITSARSSRRFVPHIYAIHPRNPRTNLL